MLARGAAGQSALVVVLVLQAGELARGEFIQEFLLLLVFPLAFSDLMAMRESVNGLQALVLLSPVFLAGNGLLG